MAISALQEIQIPPDKKNWEGNHCSCTSFFNKYDKTNFAIGHYGVWKKKEDKIDC